MSLARSTKQVFRRGEKITIDSIIPNTSPQLFVAHFAGGANYHFCQCLIGQKNIQVKKSYTVDANGYLKELPAEKPKKKKQRKVPKKKNEGPAPSAP